MSSQSCHIMAKRIQFNIKQPDWRTIFIFNVSIQMSTLGRGNPGIRIQWYICEGHNQDFVISGFNWSKSSSGIGHFQGLLPKSSVLRSTNLCAKHTHLSLFLHFFLSVFVCWPCEKDTNSHCAREACGNKAYLTSIHFTDNHQSTATHHSQDSGGSKKQHGSSPSGQKKKKRHQCV